MHSLSINYMLLHFTTTIDHCLCFANGKMWKRADEDLKNVVAMLFRNDDDGGTSGNGIFH